MTDLQWRPIPGYELLYWASNHGQILALPRLIVRRYPNGAIARHVSKSRIQKLTLDPWGYHKVAVNGRHEFAHKLVLLAFVGPAQPGQMCRHLDGVPTNNHLSNLRWGSAAENSADMVRHGTSVAGERNPNAKITAQQARQIMLGEVTEDEAVQMFGISRAYVYQVRTGRRWKKLAREYMKHVPVRKSAPTRRAT